MNFPKLDALPPDNWPRDWGFSVYALVTPVGRDVLYIGQSERPRGRVVALVGSSGDHYHVGRWIRMSEVRPDIVILERCPTRRDALDAERKWILYYRARGETFNVKPASFERERSMAFSPWSQLAGMPRLLWPLTREIVRPLRRRMLASSSAVDHPNGIRDGDSGQQDVGDHVHADEPGALSHAAGGVEANALGDI